MDPLQWSLSSLPLSLSNVVRVLLFLIFVHWRVSTELFFVTGWYVGLQISSRKLCGV